MIQDTYVAQVLCLARMMRAERQAAGEPDAGDCIDEAVHEITLCRERVHGLRNGNG